MYPNYQNKTSFEYLWCKSQEWLDAKKEEISVFEKSSLGLIELPNDKSVMDVKWVFRTKLNPDDAIFKNIAGLVDKMVVTRTRGWFYWNL